MRLFSPLRAILALLTSVALIAGLASCSQNDDNVTLLDAIRDGHVMIGSKFDEPGLGQRTPDKEHVGLDNDVARAIVAHIARKEGLPEPKITFRETPPAQRETFINNGEVQMVVATYSINAGHMKSIEFAGPYIHTHQALLVRKDAGIRGLGDIKPGTKLCSVSGSTPAQKVKQALPDVQLQEFDTYSSCAEGVHRGVVDALTTDATILAGYSQRYPGELNLVQLKNPDGSYWTDEYYGIGLGKGRDADRDAVNDAIRAIQRNGEFTDMVHKHLGKDFPLDDAPTLGDFSFVEAK